MVHDIFDFEIVTLIEIRYPVPYMLTVQIHVCTSIQYGKYFLGPSVWFQVHLLYSTYGRVYFSLWLRYHNANIEKSTVRCFTNIGLPSHTAVPAGVPAFAGDCPRFPEFSPAVFAFTLRANLHTVAYVHIFETDLSFGGGCGGLLPLMYTIVS